MIKEIFIRIAKLYGLRLTEKVETKEFFEDFSVTATLSTRLATITLIDSNIEIAGSKRADMINALVEELENTQLKKAIEVALGTGDCLLKPYRDGESVGITLIQSDDFVVTDYIGNKIKGCLIKCDEKVTDKYKYERVEFHYLQDGNLHIEQFAFKNGNLCRLDETAWSGLEDTVIANMDSMLFGRIKCPTLNRKNINSFGGVPITYGIGDVIKKTKEAYERFNQEMEDKETMIFVDKSMLNEKNGKVSIPKRKLFQTMRGSNLEDSLIKEYSPSIRANELTSGIYENFKMIELMTGLSNGVLTPPTTNFATATEIKTNLGMTFAYMQNLRKMVEFAIEELVKSVEVIYNLNNIAPLGDVDITFNWSDSYIQDLSSRATLLLQGESIGAVSKAEFRSFLMNEKVEEASEYLKELEELEV